MAQDEGEEERSEMKKKKTNETVAERCKVIEHLHRFERLSS